MPVEQSSTRIHTPSAGAQKESCIDENRRLSSRFYSSFMSPTLAALFLAHLCYRGNRQLL